MGAQAQSATPSADDSPSRLPIQWWRSIYVTTPVLLIIGIVPFARLTAGVFWGFIARLGLPLQSFTITAFWLELGLVLALTAAVIVWEKLPLNSLGLVKPRLTDLPLGFAIVVGITLADHLWEPVVAPVVGSPSVTKQIVHAMPPTFVWAILGAIMNASCEELYWRGYATERVGVITHNLLIGAGLGLIADLYCHVSYWGFPYAVELVAGQGLLTLLYLWRRSVVPCIIAHTIWDLPPYPFLMTTYLVGAILAVAPSAAIPASLYRWHASEVWFLDETAALKEISIAIKKDPGNAGAYLQRAHLYFGEMNRSKRANNLAAVETDRKNAFADLDEAIRLDPLKSEFYETRAYCYRLDGQPQPAIQDATRAIELDPKRDWSYYVRGNSYYDLDDCPRAIPDLQKYVGMKGNDAADESTLESLRDAAACELVQHELAAARASIDRTVKLLELNNDNPHLADALIVRAAIEHNTWQYGNEAEDLKRSLAINPTAPAGLTNFAELLATSPDPKFRDGKLAVTYASRACELTSWKDWTALEALAGAYAEIGQFDKAIEWQQKALELMPVSRRTAETARIDDFRHGRAWRQPFHQVDDVRFSK